MNGPRVYSVIITMARETAPVTALLALSLVAVFGLELAGGGMAVCDAYGLVPARPSFEAALSSLFLHDPDSLFHLGGNLVFLVIFGGIVERALGSSAFAGLYLAAGLGGAALHIIVNPHATEALVGCSGALCGLIAFSVVIDRRFVGFVIAFAAVNIWYALAGTGGAISFGDHIGGLFIGVVCALAQRFIGEERFA